MSWKCHICGFDDNDDRSVKCLCGYELLDFSEEEALTRKRRLLSVRPLSCSLAVVTLLSGFVLFGLLTNWFHYGMSLEALFVAAPLFATVIVVFPLSMVAFIRKSPTLLSFAFLLAVIGFTLVLAAHKEAFGNLPAFYLDHIEKSPSATVQTSGGPVEYWIELKNPFSKNHKEYLALKHSGRERRIRINILNDAAGGYAYANKAEDWAILSVTPNPDELLLILGPSLPSSGQFIVNIKN